MGLALPLYRHAGGAMLRAAAPPLDVSPAWWPTLSDPGSCRAWLEMVWTLPGFAEATRYASDPFADLVEAVVAGQVVGGRQVRRVTASVMRYLLRSVGRPTPFGLFAGVAPVRVGDDPAVSWGTGHRMVVRADTLWLDAVVEQLETTPALLAALDVVASDLIVDRGDRIEMPRGPGRVTVRNTAVIRLVRQAATTPIRFTALAGKLAEAFPNVPADTIFGTLTDLVAQGVLITNLRAPMTVTDPLGHVVETVERATPDDPGGMADMVEDLRAVQGILTTHNTDGHDRDDQARLRAAAAERMRALSTAGRTTLAGDLHLDVRVIVPHGLAQEMASAASALLRLTRQPRPDQRWNDWCREFWDRYGTGAIVPVSEAIHPDAGIGLPAGFPASVYAKPDDAVSHRDTALLRLAWDAAVAGRREVVLDDETITAITTDTPVDPRWIPPHVELGARVHTATVEALRAGDYTFTVHPAQAFGTLTSRFGQTVADAGLDTVYATTPAGVEGALAVQLSFPPLFPHSENVARIPAHLPHVLSLGEHRPVEDATNVIRLDDLGIVAVADGLHLVSISRRQVIEPQVFHALNLAKQAPPLVRFLATLTRGFLARYTEFDWGPQTSHLPFLPRVRYRRAILAPATWRINAADHTAMTTDPAGWNDAFARWRRRWRCPDDVELHDDHRSLRLTLTTPAHLILLREHLDRHGHAALVEADPAAGTGWIGGHVHEIVMPFTRATPPAPNLVTGHLPLVTNTTAAHLPGSPSGRWLYAQVFTHPERLDDILRNHLPRLLADLDSPPWWFARYRSVKETDHLRLRIRTTSPDEYAAAALAVGRWGQQLCDIGAASRLALDTYRPEVGRYGHGPAMDAAEAVFAADSHAVTLAMRLLSPQVVNPVALTAIGMVDIVDGFHPDPATATRWLLEQLAGRTAASVDRAIAAHTAAWASHQTLPTAPGCPPNSPQRGSPGETPLPITGRPYPPTPTSTGSCSRCYTCTTTAPA
ncbi:lantibiotic dehydratase [Polymorphospora rubra]|uniref:lantibiotic dehydratase n=1 Tax=Polymorphospora rubra TaxID=338584 RepID=UPI003F4D1E0D